MNAVRAKVVLSFVVALAAAVGGAVEAQVVKGGEVVHAKDLQWGPAPPSLPKGAQVAVLHGDPGREGPFVMRLMVPKGYKIAPHSHSQDEQLTVISGTLYLSGGERFDPSTARGIGAGGFHFLPAKAVHFAYAKAPTIVQINGNGPFDITYVKPDDDPRKVSH